MLDFGKILSLLARLIVFSFVASFLGTSLYLLLLVMQPFRDAFYAVFMILGYHQAVMSMFLSAFTGSVIVSVFVFFKSFIR